MADLSEKIRFPQKNTCTEIHRHVPPRQPLRWNSSHIIQIVLPSVAAVSLIGQIRTSAGRHSANYKRLKIKPYLKMSQG
jgi:hypothetical protein